MSPKGDKIAIAGKKIKAKGQKEKGDDPIEIGIFSICPKLLVSCPAEQGRNNKRDFALVAGARMPPGSQAEDVKQLHFLGEESVVAVSAGGVSVWRIKEGTDLMTLAGQYKVNYSVHVRSTWWQFNRLKNPAENPTENPA